MKLYLKQTKYKEIITDKKTNDLIYDTDKQEWLKDWKWIKIPLDEWRKYIKQDWREYDKATNERLLYINK